MINFIHWLSGWIHIWATGILNERHEEAMRKAFPPGCRVEFLFACPCGRKHAGKLGTIVRVIADASDYEAKLDVPEFYPNSDLTVPLYVCAKGMKRV